MKFTKYIVPGMKEERGTKKVDLLMGEGSTMEEDLVGIIRGERKEKLPVCVFLGNFIKILVFLEFF